MPAAHTASQKLEGSSIILPEEKTGMPSARLSILYIEPAGSLWTSLFMGSAGSPRLPYSVQSSMRNPGTLRKSLAFRVTKTISCDKAMAAIRRSMVPTRTRWADVEPRASAASRTPPPLPLQNAAVVSVEKVFHACASASAGGRSAARMARPNASTSSNAGSSLNEPVMRATQFVATGRWARRCCHSARWPA